MSNSTLIIINGPPGAGKTTLGRRLAKDLGLPFIGKDDIKEILFDVLGWTDREWTRRLGQASVEVMFMHLTRQLEAGMSAVTENAFIPAYDTDHFLALKRQHDFEPIQIYCDGDPDVLAERFFARDGSGERHPGHVDPLAKHADFVAVLQSAKYGILAVGGQLIELDMTDLDNVDYEALLATIEFWEDLPGTAKVPGR